MFDYFFNQYLRFEFESFAHSATLFPPPAIFSSFLEPLHFLSDAKISFKQNVLLV
jgi:hypothetical protein